MCVCGIRAANFPPQGHSVLVYSPSGRFHASRMFWLIPCMANFVVCVCVWMGVDSSPLSLSLSGVFAFLSVNKCLADPRAGAKDHPTQTHGPSHASL